MSTTVMLYCTYCSITTSISIHNLSFYASKSEALVPVFFFSLWLSDAAVSSQGYGRCHSQTHGELRRVVAVNHPDGSGESELDVC